MKEIETGSVDMILTDPPYGTTACKWDSIIDLDLMWEQLKRIIKPNGAIVLFGSEPFSSALRMSNIRNYKYDWIWDKKKPGAIGIAKFQPLRYTENISVFNCSYKNYNPQMTERSIIKESRNYTKSMSGGSGLSVMSKKNNYTHKYPKNIIEISNANQNQDIHKRK